LRNRMEATSRLVLTPADGTGKLSTDDR